MFSFWAMDKTPDQKSATFLFYGELNDFLPLKKKSQPIAIYFRGRQSVKHLIESLGVPHVEVGKMLVDNHSAIDFNYLVNDQEWLYIYPPTIPIPLPQTANFPTEEVCRFVVDNHLGRLAAYLRMFGFDTIYHPDIQDEELAQIADQDERILLTRDHRLLMRSCIHYGYWVRSKLPAEQIREIIQRWDLARHIRPFRRCIRCNGLLTPIQKDLIIDKLQPLTKKYFDDFHICQNCHQIYWRGSHFDRMVNFINHTLQE
ncbi:MAG: Mut7-C RNAse domain-containing protein [Anaerolineales bacterium]